MKAIVVGGLGFIGSVVSRKLLKRGYEVTIVDDCSVGRREDAPIGAEFVKMNCSRMKRLGWKADVVYHFGSKSSILHYFKDPSGVAFDTIAGWKGVLDYCKANRVRLVAASSATVYGTAPLPQSERGSTYPVNDYSIGKLLCERMSRGADVALLRPFTGYGPGEMAKTWFKSPVGMFIDDALNGRPLTIFGDGTQTRDFIYIEDLAEAAIRIGESSFIGPINIGTGVETTMNQLASMVEKAFGKRCERKRDEKFQNYVNHMRADVSLFKEVVKMQPMSLEQGVALFMEHEANRQGKAR